MMRKIKVAILTCSLELGGAERHLYNLLGHIGDEYEFAVICLYHLGAIGDMIQRNIPEVKIYHSIMKSRGDVPGALKLRRILLDEKCDILYIVHTPVTLFWGIFCARTSGNSAIMSRSPSTNPSKHGKRLKLVSLLTKRYLDRIVAQAYTHKEYLIKNYHFDSRKIAVIQNGVDLKRFEVQSDTTALKKNIGIPQNAPVAGIIARLSRQKGFPVLLQAVKKVAEDYQDVVFLIVGEGEERRELEEMSRNLFIESNIRFLGRRDDVPEIISLFDIALLTSRPVGETFSNAILEYMAASKPVIATDVGSISEQVIDGKTGLLIKYGDCEGLANAVMRLLRDRGLAIKMGEAGRKLAEEKFSIQKMVKRYKSLFEEGLQLSH